MSPEVPSTGSSPYNHLLSPFLGGQPASSGVDTWHITLLVSPIPGGGPALRTLQGASNPFHLLPSLYSSSLGPQPCPPPPRPGMPWWDPLATGHLASGEGVTHLAPLCAGSRGRASTAALAKLRANPCCGVAKPSPASAHQQKCLHDPSSIFLGCAEPLTPCAAL